MEEAKLIEVLLNYYVDGDMEAIRVRCYYVLLRYQEAYTCRKLNDYRGDVVSNIYSLRELMSTYGVNMNDSDILSVESENTILARDTTDNQRYLLLFANDLRTKRSGD